VLPSHNRYEFKSLADRADYSWPAGKRLAFYIATNLEHFAFKAGIAVAGTRRTHREYAARDYGLRVGLTYLMELFDDLGIRVAHNVNSTLYDDRPAVFRHIRARGDEVIAHGRTNSERQDDMWEDDEARMIREVTETIAHNEGAPPKGWMGPARAETGATPDILQELGYRYIMDWPCDDQPFWMRTRSGRILSVPYPLEVNDGREQTAQEFADVIVNQFDEMLEQSTSRPLVCGIALHPFFSGHPFRLRPLRQALTHCVRHGGREQVWYTVPGEISDYCHAMTAGIVP
jgi:peptidoglycan/xylan/chitin deacetylase (PgdA/CDA1 family)